MKPSLFDCVIIQTLPHFRAIIQNELMFIFLDDPLEFTSAGGPGYIRMEDTETGQQQVVSRKKLSELERELRSKRRSLRKEELEKKRGIYSVVLEYSEQGRHYNRLQKFFLKRHRALNSRRA